MRRFLPTAVLALLVVAVATPVNAGYLVIRILLEGSGATDAAPNTGVQVGAPPMGPMGAGISGPPMGSGLGPPGGIPGVRWAR